MSDSNCPKCRSYLQWVEGPGPQSRVLSWFLYCPHCNYYPEER